MNTEMTKERALDEVIEHGSAMDRAKINSIRLDGRSRPFEKKRSIAKLVLQALAQSGRLIRTPDNTIYFFNATKKTLEPIEGEEFRSALYDQFGLNPTEEDTRFVERDLKTDGMCRGERAEVRSLSFWSEKDKSLYVSGNNGTLFRLDGETISTHDNGTDGVLFLSDRRADLVQPDFGAPIEHFTAVFDGLSLAGDDASKSKVLALIKVWVLGIFFLEAIPVRPILALIGEQGSGKTTLARRVGLVLYGPSFDVGSFRTDATGEADFIASISARRFVAFDNADARIKWLPDHLAKIATGAGIERRKLYTTNELQTFPTNCFLAITSRDPRWKRDDVTQRLLPVRMETIGTEKLPESNLKRAVSEARPLIWGAMLNAMNRVIAAIREEQGVFTSAHRLADFHRFGYLASPALGVEEEFSGAMESLNREQMALLGEGDEKLDLFKAWFQTKTPDWTGETLDSQELFQALKTVYSGLDHTFLFPNPTSLGSWIGRHKELLKSQCGVTVDRERTSTERKWFFRK